MQNESDKQERLQRALLSLDGLSLGDAFGETLAMRAKAARQVVARRELPPGPWWHTDDTQMAMAIVEELNRLGTIEPDALAERLATRFERDENRGYGKGSRTILRSILRGTAWQEAANTIFSGNGSKGNGGAMRVAPLGAWFADDLDPVVEEAQRSAIVTHSHPEGIAGAIAIAVAAATAWRERHHLANHTVGSLWREVLRCTPEGETRHGILRASELSLDTPVDDAAMQLGSGYLVTSPDTVPFALWCACRHLDNFKEAMLSTLEGDGDCDTNCAIVGGIVSLYVGADGIPKDWLSQREKLDLCNAAEL